jgi:hypothetical protein
VSGEETKLPQVDAERFAATLLYARGPASLAYAETRRADAVARADCHAAEYWSTVEKAILAKLAISDGQ